ncbi:MAG: glycosyltransferase family 2 protein [Desulfobacteraceae bacterium]|nr:glycosyltransferase family 2 protein [Desulfobacteraceae bacterium]
MLSVVIPVFNEEHAVKNVIDEIKMTFLNKIDFEIIAVDDGSSDKSLEILKSLECENLKVISHVENLGYGKSLFDGIVEARYDCIAIIDSDGSYPVKDILSLLEYYPQYDMVIGARTGQEIKRGFFKSLARFMFNQIAQYASGRKIDDINSGLRIFRKDVILKYRDDMCTGFSFTTTITLIFFLNFYFVKYIPIDYHKRIGKTKVKHFKDTLRAAQIIVQAILHYNPIKLFLLLAVLNALLGVGLGFLNYLFFDLQLLRLTSALTICSSVPIFAAGLIAEQIKKITTSMKPNK